MAKDKLLHTMDLTVSDDGWIIDLDGIKAKEADQFTAAIDAAVSGQDKTALVPWLAKVIKAWPYNEVGSPSDPASYDELGLVQVGEVGVHFWAAFSGYTEKYYTAPDSGKANGEGRPAGAPEGAHGA